MSKINFKKVMSMITGIGLIIGCGATLITTTSCAKVALELTGGRDRDWGLYEHQGQIQNKFVAKVVNSDKDPDFVWTLVSESDTSIADFSISDGLIKWNDEIEMGTYVMHAHVIDTTSNTQADSHQVTIEIMGQPPRPPVNIPCNNGSTKWDPASIPTNELSDFSTELITHEDGTKGIQINGFSNTYSIVDKKVSIKPASEYLWNDGVTYPVTDIGPLSFNTGAKGTLDTKVNEMKIVLPSSLLRIHHDAFCSDNSCKKATKLFIDLSACEILTEPSETTYEKNDDTGYWFSFSNVQSFIAPTHNEALNWLPDDMFENSYFECDIDLRGFVKLDTIGHWATGRWNLDNADCTGVNGNAYGTLIIPGSVEHVTWAAFTSSLIKNLYWDVGPYSSIDWNNNYWGMADICEIFTSAHFENMHLGKTADTDEWYDEIVNKSHNWIWEDFMGKIAGPGYDGASVANIATDYPEA